MQFHGVPDNLRWIYFNYIAVTSTDNLQGLDTPLGVILLYHRSNHAIMLNQMSPTDN